MHTYIHIQSMLSFHQFYTWIKVNVLWSRNVNIFLLLLFLIFNSLTKQPRK